MPITSARFRQIKNHGEIDRTKRSTLQLYNTIRKSLGDWLFNLFAEINVTRHTINQNGAVCKFQLLLGAVIDIVLGKLRGRTNVDSFYLNSTKNLFCPKKPTLLREYHHSANSYSPLASLLRRQMQ